MQSQWKSEAQFQAECVKWFDKEFPTQRGRLIGIYNNPKNSSQLISMGMRPGISDLLYFPLDVTYIRYFKDGSSIQDTMIRPPAWIELKVLGRKQNDNQIRFQSWAEGVGHKYHVVTEYLHYFQNLIKSYQ